MTTALRNLTFLQDELKIYDEHHTPGFGALFDGPGGGGGGALFEGETVGADGGAVGDRAGSEASTVPGEPTAPAEEADVGRIVGADAAGATVGVGLKAVAEALTSEVEVAPTTAAEVCDLGGKRDKGRGFRITA
uniref:Uncharacterized protein n=1 Tax=Pristionchus pacificus TaxID=54126 RepID=A0A2A6B3N2_PRIPA|eukprot:PDM60495.1 hypothetical protein PRIPAC_53473 [Pristionchus pacificus]